MPIIQLYLEVTVRRYRGVVPSTAASTMHHTCPPLTALSVERVTVERARVTNSIEYVDGLSATKCRANMLNICVDPYPPLPPRYLLTTY